MPWPNGSSDSSASRKDNEESRKGPSTWVAALGVDIDWDHYKEAKNWVPTLLVTVTALSGVAFYRSYLRRFPGTAYIDPKLFRRRSLFGKVTSVGDGDNFHFFHTPGGRLAGWGWLRNVPTAKAELRGQTVQ
jgi:hypothetical protein